MCTESLLYLQFINMPISLAQLPIHMSVTSTVMQIKQLSCQEGLLSSTQTIKHSFCHILCWKEYNHGN